MVSQDEELAHGIQCIRDVLDVTAGTDAVVIPLPRKTVTNENGRFQTG